MSRWCAVHRPLPPDTVSARAGLRAVVEFSNEEVLEACGRLAIAHRSLTRCGDRRAAQELAAVFALLEQRVAFLGRPSGPPPG